MIQEKNYLIHVVGFDPVKLYGNAQRNRQETRSC